MRRERGRDCARSRRPRRCGAITTGSTRFTCTKSARTSASRCPPPRSTADGCSVGNNAASTPARVNGKCCPRSLVMPSFVSSSSLVAKLPSVTITRGRISIELAVEPRRARVDLLGLRIAVARRPALHDVGDVHVGALQADALDELRQQLPGAPDERFALQVFLLARAFADEHEVGVGPPDAEDDLRAPRRELAQRAVVRERRDLGEGGHGRVGGMRRGGQRHGRCYPGSTAARIAAATTSAVVAGAGRGARRPLRSRTRWRGRRRSGCAPGGGTREPVVRALRDQVAAGLVATPSVTTTTSVVFAVSSNGRWRGKAERAGRRGRTGEHRAVLTDDVADRVDDGERRDRGILDRACATPRPPGTAYSRPRHFPTVAPAPPPTPPGFERVVALAHDRGGVALGAPGRREPGFEQVEDRRGRDDRHRPPAVAKPRPRSAR